jgi:periplasmic protein TonB
MKKGVLLIAGLLYFSINGFTQTIDSAHLQTENDSIVFTKVEVEAVAPASWGKYLQYNLNASIGTNNGAPPGTYKVLVQFIVRKDGSVTDVRAITHYGFGMEQEVVRVMQNSPKWTPATQNGHVVNAYRVQPVTFQIEN